ncbi:Oidioi.mRNA.OKI2018_I69.chr1.g1380.t1.cds [Oikopleura dioica]|uniref:Oidioi.mRNA.OKI2018_I69.chr1.g1380.t1.cds n=1 Tax=Oikopleura dioica TaxID=34765 RepID=A0ABN7SMQ3_OIKDI|nr:Oidioi.mRNA.OKI2018_I69.chr1.g1380.t1.cds [Oikopleura dioica]
MKLKQSDESPSSDDNSRERVIDEGESSEIDIPPLERAAEFSQPSPHFKSPEKTSNKSSNSKVASNLDPDEPTELLQSQKSTDGRETQETQPSQLSRYEMMERAAEFLQRTSQEELLNDEVPSDPEISLSVSGELFDDEVPSDPEISLSVSGELFNDELQPMDTTEISQQEEKEANSSQGSSVYETPEKSLPKTPSKADQSAPATPPQPSRKLRRSLFNENQEEEPMESPEIIMASSGDTTVRSKKVELKDSWSQVSGETLRETEGRKRRTHDALNLCAGKSQEERKKKSQEGINQTQRVGDLLNHTALALDSQQSTQATQARQESTSATQLQPQEESQGTNEKYFTPPTSPTLEEASATQKTFDEDLNDDYFAKLASDLDPDQPTPSPQRNNSWSQVSGKTLRKTGGRKKRTHDPVDFCAEESPEKKSQEEMNQTQRWGDLLNHSALVLGSQQSAQATQDRHESTSATQKTFDEDLDDDYFAKLKSPTRNTETKKIKRQSDQAKQQKRVYRKIPRSRAKPTRDELDKSLARALRKLQAGGISRRLEFARAFISTTYRPRDSSLNREFEKAISWEPKPREEQESAHNWSQQALFDESAEDRQALSPEHDQSPPAPIDREDVREFMFPTSNKRKLQTPEKDARGEASAKDHAAKRSKHEKENIPPKKSASKPTILTPAVDVTIARRPGTDIQRATSSRKPHPASVRPSSRPNIRPPPPPPVAATRGPAPPPPTGPIFKPRAATPVSRDSLVETPVDTNPEYGTFDNTANVTNLPSERNAADTTNPEYETFDRSLNVTAGTSEQPEPAFSGSSSDVSSRRSARKDDKGTSIADAVKARRKRDGMSHNLNPRQESIASNQREESDESASEESVQPASSVKPYKVNTLQLLALMK